MNTCFSFLLKKFEKNSMNACESKAIKYIVATYKFDGAGSELRSSIGHDIDCDFEHMQMGCQN